MRRSGGAGDLRHEQGADEERVLAQLDDPDLAVGVGTAHDKSGGSQVRGRLWRSAASLRTSRPEPRDLVATVEMAGGLAIVLVAAAPSGGGHDTSDLRWAAALASTVAVAAVLLGISRRCAGSACAFLLGASSGLSFGLAAALLDTTASHGSRGVVSLFASWQLYAMVVAGVSGLLFLQHAFAAGPFMAAQPPATVLDPLASVGYGLLLFGEHMRGGLLIVPELVGAAMIAHGAVALSRSALLVPEAVARPRAPGAPGQREG